MRWDAIGMADILACPGAPLAAPFPQPLSGATAASAARHIPALIIMVPEITFAGYALRSWNGMAQHGPPLFGKPTVASSGDRPRSEFSADT